ncbi:hypothetical protein [Vagococcus bubulae]|uniref:Uncharacterized protein n=1 Tax=Vagococcus bubulae TaxID=1977868 RepID=A0A429ZKA1_9ENTE|nr:hypothetical protein [Vagococcus bubulae]RST94089.1 hypothetical protein CBF36_06830 [Vagococcus bubulae]
MTLYQQYLKTKSCNDDFLKWLLIKRLNLKQQLLIIFILWMMWIGFAPYLNFWLSFFKGAVLISIFSAIISFITKRLNN